jgi:hypothetical protein
LKGLNIPYIEKGEMTDNPSYGSQYGAAYFLLYFSAAKPLKENQGRRGVFKYFYYIY